jgi:hemerythrin-like domain-containing protein
MQYQVQFAKEHQANAQLLRDLVEEIERLEDANKNT